MNITTYPLTASRMFTTSNEIRFSLLNPSSSLYNNEINFTNTKLWPMYLLMF